MNVGSNSVNAARLLSLTEQIEARMEAKDDIAADIKDLYTIAGSEGYDTKILRKAIARRRMDAAAREEQDALLEVYERALGQLRDTPLGAAAMARVGQ